MTAIGENKQRRIYISELAKFVLFTPMVVYKDELLVNVLDNISTDPNGILKNAHLREQNYEKEFIDLIKSLHPSFYKQFPSDFFNLHHEEMIRDQWFFSTYEKLLENNIEIYGLKDLKNFNYSPYKASIYTELKSNQDWFELDASVTFGDQQASMKEIRKAIIKRSRYIKLGDGTYGILPAEWFEKFTNFMRQGEVVNNSLRISNLRFSLIDELFGEITSESVLKEIGSKKNRIKQFSEIKQVDAPPELISILRSYQLESLNWMNFLYEMGWGGILADDMGLGKTLQILAFLLKQKATTKHANLVVVPTTLMFNWEIEIKKFTPSLKIYFYHGINRIKDHSNFGDYDIVITTYRVMTSDIEVLRKYKFSYTVLDESHAIKNPQSQRFKAACLLKAENKLALTGTPIENNTIDLYAQMSYLNPGFLGNLKYFKDYYGLPIDKERNTQRAEELQKMVRPFVMRRTKEQVAPELPAKTESILYCTMENEQRKVYDAFRNKYRNLLITKIDAEGINKSKISVIEGLLKLRQICDSPELLAETEDYGRESVKVNELVKHITYKSCNHKILVFSQFVGMLSLIRQRLDDTGIIYEYIDGKCDIEQRKQSVEHFQTDSNCRVFLISLKAGGTGLNLTEADYVYLVDPWWNPAVENQAIDRCHRIGQNKKVFAYRMICKDTVEEKIMDYQARKKQIADEIIQTDESFLKQLGREDILELFG